MVVLRRRIKHDVVLTGAKRGDKAGRAQRVLAFGHDEVLGGAQMWEYTVLVTNAPYDIRAIGQLYRDRCDCENGFDALKNQWGWGGFTTQDMHRSQITARGGPGVQRVELVRACGQPHSATRGVDQPPVAAGSGGASRQPTPVRRCCTSRPCTPRWASSNR